jgi:hypothetical protein
MTVPGKVAIQRVVAIATWLLVFGCACAAAQEARELRGTVEDRTGGVIVDAAIHADHASGSQFDARTDGSGKYRLAGLPPGVYIVTISSPGFAKAVSRIDLTARRSRTFDATLQIAMEEQVEVSATESSAAVDTTGTFSVSGKDVDALPDDPAAFVRRLQEMIGGGGGGSADNAPVRVNGFAPGGRIPPKAAIQFIRFTTNAFAAEFAEPGRGMIEIVTKPGATKLLGELDLNFNDDGLNARNAFAARRTPMQTRALSGYIAGPIIANRWGFQLFGGHWMRDTENLVNATVLAGGSLTPQPFVTTVGTPTRTRSGSLGTDYLIGKLHRIAVTVDYSDERGLNQGLGSGLDLPERTFTRSVVTPGGSLALTSSSRAGLTNELRLEWSRPRSETRARSSESAVLVLDTFNGGGNQRSLFRDDRSNSVKFADRVTMTRGRHRLKAGVDLETLRSEQVDESEFGGSFVFGSDFERDLAGAIVGGEGDRIAITPLENYRRTLLGLPGYGPSQLTIERGDPTLTFSRWWLGTFAQGDWNASPRLTLSYGVRHSLQADLHSASDVAPRVGLAWALDAKNRSRIRTGVGLFHQQIPTELVFNALRYDGRRQRFVVSRPAFSVAAPTGAIAQTRVSTYQVPDDLVAPRTVLSTTTFDRNLPHGINVSIGYTLQRGDRLLRLRNINAPAAGAAQLPHPEAGPILEYQSTGRSMRHEMPLTFRGSLSKKISLRANYTLGFRRSDTDGPSSTPADSYALGSEYGPADGDRRHRGFVLLGLTLPAGIETSWSGSFSSGRPFNITTGRDNNGDSLFTDRPSFAAAGASDAIRTPFGAFNPNPQPGEAIVPRNYGREPRQVRVDLYISKTLKPGGKSARALTLSASTTNLFNAINLSGTTGVITSQSFGRPRRAGDARRIDLAAKWTF